MNEATSAAKRMCPNQQCRHENTAESTFCARCGGPLPALATPVPAEPEEVKSPLREIVQPFIDLVHAPRALWGINLAYFLEGFVYFGMLGYLAMYFNEYPKLNDAWAGRMVMVLTAGITIAMFFLGRVADLWGVRRAILTAFCLMLVGRICLASGPYLGLPGEGLGSPVHLIAMMGILLIVVGYGMYQPGAYAAVKQFTSGKTAGMGFAILYALMNLGGFLPTFFSPIRQKWGIAGAYWVYVFFTVTALLCTVIILSRATVAQAIARAAAEKRKAAGGHAPTPEPAKPREPFSLRRWLANHPLADVRFAFFIFALMPVQTLFAHNWLTLPMYVERGFRESWPWISKNFEPAVNFNPLLIFVLVPMIAAVTQKRKVYNMMVLGTLIMAAPTFLLALGPKPRTLAAYIVIMTVGEAIWQPRFLQHAAEIAPEGRTGAYMGVAQFPWFCTKMLVPLYSGWFLARYCPEEGVTSTEQMWLVYACIAMVTPVLLVLGKSWVGASVKSKNA